MVTATVHHVEVPPIHNMVSVETPAARKVSATEAYLLVMDKFKNDIINDSHLHIEFDHMEGTTYVFQIYDQMSYGQATVNWANVTEMGKLTTWF
jgi:hypothetical protein